MKAWKRILLGVPFLSSAWSHLCSSLGFGFQYRMTSLVKKMLFREKMPAGPSSQPYLPHPLPVDWAIDEVLGISFWYAIYLSNRSLSSPRAKMSIVIPTLTGKLQHKKAKQSNRNRAQNIPRSLCPAQVTQLEVIPVAHKHPSSKKSWPYISGWIRKTKQNYQRPNSSLVQTPTQTLCSKIQHLLWFLGVEFFSTWDLWVQRHDCSGSFNNCVIFNSTK